MNKEVTQRGRYVLLGLLALVLMAGCAPSTGTVQETATALSPTPDPLYTLHCIRQSGKGDLCYVSDVLAADPELLEKTVRSFCLNKMDFVCAIHVWNDESNVPQSVPLTDAEKASRIAFFSSNGGSGVECYQTFSEGEVVSSAGDCK